jgi:hypothetical protein
LFAFVHFSRFPVDSQHVIVRFGSVVYCPGGEEEESSPSGV